MKRLTQEEFENKFYKFYEGQFKIKGKYINAITPVEIECLNCGHIISQTPNHYDKGRTKCPYCCINGNTHTVIKGVNDIWTTHPNVGKYLLNPEDGYKYRINTQTELDFVCPVCQRIRHCKPNLLINEFKCCFCSDKNKYPNKFMANILDLLNIKFIPEYHIGNYSFRYDFKFEKDNKKYVVEMDGGYGHGNISKNNIYTREEQIQIDRLKDSIAKENGFIMIRIDCKYSSVAKRKEFISNNILKSELSNLFNITNSVINKADLMAQNSQIKIFADLWNIGIRSYDEFIDRLHVCARNTIRSYAKVSIELGLIQISYEEFLKQIRISSNYKIANSKGNPVTCDQTGEIFYSISEAARKTGLTSLSSYFSQNRSYCGKLKDGTKLTWHKLNKDEYTKLKAS